ncbi:hypothetical protein [Moritella sp. JT01]|uniref:hypothetical protein n=1 Tax=Moritella sp. JT01 TaxID=756698 RepID=UPI000833E787|nr:hypothetical protein [Moritella sp. JT01]
MNNSELADLYMKLSMRYEEEFPVECGFEIATKERMNMIDKIRVGSLSNKDIRTIDPIFSYGNVDISDHIKPKKRFLFF